MSLVWHGPECRAAVVAELAGFADEAGKLGVKVARENCPVKTGFLRSTIGYTLDKKTLLLTLYADASYSFVVEVRHPYLRIGQAAMSQVFAGTSAIQFTNVPEKYQEGARSRVRQKDFRKAVIGHRRPRNRGRR